MNIRHKKIEQIRITCSSADRDKAFAYCKKHGYRITQSSPLRKGPSPEFLRFGLTGERPLREEKPDTICSSDLQGRMPASVRRKVRKAIRETSRAKLEQCYLAELESRFHWQERCSKLERMVAAI